MNELNWRFTGNELKYLKEVLELGFKAGADGAFSTLLEKEFAQLYKTKYSIAFNSGTSTLHAALLALGCMAKDEVLVPSLTPLMCGLAPYYTGAIPVFVDVDADTFLMDPIDLEAKITEKSKVILVVHMYGNVCEMQKIEEIAKKHNLQILEDCAQCQLGHDDLNRLAGTIGAAGSWSFENSKQLTSGDGGIITTNDEELATKIRKIGGLGFKTLTAQAGRVRTDRNLLQNPNWERFDEIGFNYRMTQLAAAVALAQVERSRFFIDLRVKSGNSYKSRLQGSALLTPQKVLPGYRNTYYTFSAKFNSEQSDVNWESFRSKYIEFGGDGIYAASKLLYQEPVFRDRKIGKGRTPVAERLQRSLMNFTTNQSNESEIEKQADVLEETLRFFGDLK
jgi:perosamine synthetase